MNNQQFRFGYELRQSAGSDEAEIMIYSSIVQYKYKDDPEITAAEFDKLLKEAKASGTKKLRLRINSPGGSVWQAVAMKAMLEGSGFDEINVDIEGLCASAATFFVCTKNAHVRICQGSEFMIHNPSTIEWGDAAALEKTAARMRKMENDQHQMYAARTGKKPEEIREMMDAETWLTAQEAVDNGFCDEVTGSSETCALMSTEAQELVQSLYQHPPMLRSGEITYVRNATPTAATENKQTTKEGTHMDINEQAQQLRTENRELYESILETGRSQERERIRQIDEMTDEGFEEMARSAKEAGTSAADFLVQVVAAKRQRKRDYLEARARETGNADRVSGGAARDNDGANEEAELSAFAKEMASYRS